jgi:Flp pilus assembly pilin Flp
MNIYYIQLQWVGANQPTHNLVGSGAREGQMKEFLTSFWINESGISAVEYTLLLTFVAAGIIAAAGAMGTSVEGEMMQAADCIDDTTNC